MFFNLRESLPEHGKGNIYAIISLSLLILLYVVGKGLSQNKTLIIH